MFLQLFCNLYLLALLAVVPPPSLLSVDSQRLSVRVAGRQVRITGLQLRLLLYLWDRRDWVLSRTQIIDEVWGHGADVSVKVVDVHVCRLRRRLAEAGGLVEAVRSYGYRLNTESEHQDGSLPARIQSH